ncbi:hypothetical protein B0T21DRAFT_350692 [Apiosordaria backusii]|uniref:Uncharacterized protein n=1 Tax=Apiosordaria backusii TaxID=314023 RepID=A0AA40B2P4_9PEZI|nr:hypothetical protein B0T21DRAFT_350692 [Apiosordaria backusii]
MSTSLLSLTGTCIVMDDILDHLELPNVERLHLTCKPMNVYINTYLGNQACRAFTTVGLTHAITLIRLSEFAHRTKVTDNVMNTVAAISILQGAHQNSISMLTKPSPCSSRSLFSLCYLHKLSTFFISNFRSVQQFEFQSMAEQDIDADTHAVSGPVWHPIPTSFFTQSKEEMKAKRRSWIAWAKEMNKVIGDNGRPFSTTEIGRMERAFFLLELLWFIQTAFPISCGFMTRAVFERLQVWEMEEIFTAATVYDHHEAEAWHKIYPELSSHAPDMSVEKHEGMSQHGHHKCRIDFFCDILKPSQHPHRFQALVRRIMHAGNVETNTIYQVKNGNMLGSDYLGLTVPRTAIGSMLEPTPLTSPDAKAYGSGPNHAWASYARSTGAFIHDLTLDSYGTPPGTLARDYRLHGWVFWDYDMTCLLRLEPVEDEEGDFHDHYRRAAAPPEETSHALEIDLPCLTPKGC